MKKDIQLLILLIIIGIVYFYFVKKKSKKITNILCLVAIVFFSAKIFHDNFFKSTIEGVQNMQSDEQKLKTLKAMNTFLKDTLVKKSGVQTTQKNEIAKIADTAKNIGDHVENLFGANQNEFAAAIKYLNLDEKDENIKIIEGFNNNDKKIVKELVNNIKTSVNKLFNILQTLIVPNSRLNEHDSTNNSIHKEIAILRSLYARDNIVLCENIKNNMPIYDYEHTKEWAQDNGYEVIEFVEGKDNEEINGTPPGAFKVKNNQDFSIIPGLDKSNLKDKINPFQNTVYWNPKKTDSKFNSDIKITYELLKDIKIERIYYNQDKYPHKCYHMKYKNDDEKVDIDEKFIAPVFLSSKPQTFKEEFKFSYYFGDLYEELLNMVRNLFELYKKNSKLTIFLQDTCINKMQKEHNKKITDYFDLLSKIFNLKFKGSNKDKEEVYLFKNDFDKFENKFNKDISQINMEIEKS